MSGRILVRNRQELKPINTSWLRQISHWLLVEQLGAAQFDLCLYLVAASEMARLNGKFLNHKGSTDVITFGYADNSGQCRGDACSALHGEIFICIDDAVAQARQFRTTWQSEVVRYVIHGVLHLQGFDDSKPAARKKMKHEENRLVREIETRFALSQLARLNRKSQIANHRFH